MDTMPARPARKTLSIQANVCEHRCQGKLVQPYTHEQTKLIKEKLREKKHVHCIHEQIKLPTNSSRKICHAGLKGCSAITHLALKIRSSVKKVLIKRNTYWVIVTKFEFEIIARTTSNQHENNKLSLISLPLHYSLILDSESKIKKYA